MSKNPCNSGSSKLSGVAQAVAQRELQDVSKYYYKHGDAYYFSRRAPSPFKPGETVLLSNNEDVRVGANGYFRFPLGTSSAVDAKKTARKYASLLDDALDRRLLREQYFRLKRGEIFVAPREATDQELAKAAERMYQTLLVADEKTSAAAFDQAIEADGDPEEIAEIRDGDRYAELEKLLPPDTSIGRAQLVRSLSREIGMVGHYLHQVVPGEALVCSDFRRLIPFAETYIRAIKDLERRREGKPVEAPLSPSSAIIEDASIDGDGAWDDAFQAYVRVHQPSKKTFYSYHKAWETLRQSAKCSLKQLELSHVVRWRDELLSEGLARSTINNHITHGGTIWQTARSNALIPSNLGNPFDGTKLLKQRNAQRSREEFSLDELKVLFRVPPLETAAAISVHSGYWLPILAMYHGARLEELTGLLVADIFELHGVPVMRIFENDRRPSLKNFSSKRTIPLHPKLLELGFLEYVETARMAKVKALFPSTQVGRKFGEHYVAWARGQLNLSEGRLIGMHCFRHGWETARRNGLLDGSTANYLAGRRMEGNSAVDYGSPAGLVIQLQELSKIKFDLEFQPAPEVTVQQLQAQETRAIRNKAAKVRQLGKSLADKYLS